MRRTKGKKPSTPPKEKTKKKGASTQLKGMALLIRGKGGSGLKHLIFEPER